MATPAGKRQFFSSAVELAAAVEGKEFAKAVQRQLDDTFVVNTLRTIRVTRGLSQATVAKAIGCSPSRISRIENSCDHELRLGDLQEYARALGCQLHVTLSLPMPERIGICKKESSSGKQKLLSAQR